MSVTGDIWLCVDCRVLQLSQHEKCGLFSQSGRGRISHMSVHQTPVTLEMRIVTALLILRPIGSD